MKLLKLALVATSVMGALTGCSNTAPQQSNSKPVSSFINAVVSELSAEQQLDVLVNQYYEESLTFAPIRATYSGKNEFNDVFTPEISVLNRDKKAAFYKKYQQRLGYIDSEQLTGQALLSYEILKRDLALNLEGMQFPSYLLPINQMSGAHNIFAGFGSGQSAQPFKTMNDYANFIKRSDGFVKWLKSVELSMAEGIKQNIVLPSPLAKKLAPQFSAHVVNKAEDSLFWGPINNLPDSFTAEQKQEITAQYRDLIMTQLVPAYQSMHTFLINDYIPNSRASVGYSDFTNGKAWYEYQIKKNTTLSLSADEIHDIGLSEVSRILSEMKQVKQTVGFDGDLPAFFTHLRDSDEFYFNTAEELVEAYENVKKKIDAKVPLLFDVAPKAPYVVKPVEAYRAQSAAGASYAAPAPDGSRPGIFYINTFNLKAQPKFLLETLSIHEAAPGHHFQIALQQEIDGLPDFRKFGGYTVFAEGWALYAESLGKELGLFTDPYMWYGRLADEQLRAMRLVLDTGFHAKGWTREQGIQYMLANSSMAKSDVVAEVERYIAWPGQALSYKLGEFKIKELRDYCKKELGNRFDIKAFHTQILIDGALPMPILEKKIKRWVQSQQ
ncbi:MULTISPECIES: DUF885 domain-containing protein [unclassified Pseudoalteromonas]|uniref:DUF885 domain-containing protein n=1 Tax=unclassified Pseudoalteromonas TaxID=194690 RepID=UPI0011080C34|nr:MULTISPECIES: DUF885 domain-containing protein [unclassified Pseudoalteromonas]TMN84606.1 DUF885 domain-containing protein [Pseudoalteromonas sp. S410]TMN91177.1 DUF885 domain-containing protein [Pseudoalteromonas sp. S408]TMN98056.1 DUF885 domain-containing protein [Pseudoalteromonas sp. S407]TMN99941.1 DUF885 domain-containing protein [Pseudoalteromonas sp. S409]TMO11745.1 DUF885 domain-containing protein [Pseudoalteromonas sp. S186]